MASGDKRKEESAEEVEEVGRASLPWAVEGRRVCSLGWGGPPPPRPCLGEEPPPPLHKAGCPLQAALRSGGKVRPLPPVSDPVEDASVGAGRAGGKGCSAGPFFLVLSRKG